MTRWVGRRRAWYWRRRVVCRRLDGLAPRARAPAGSPRRRCRAGASKATVAAECTTTSHEARRRRPSSSRSSPSRPTSPATAVSRAAMTSSKRVAQLVAQPVEAVVAHHLACQAGCGVRSGGWGGPTPPPRTPGRRAAGARPARCPRKPVAPVTKMRLPDRAPAMDGPVRAPGCRGGRHLGHDLCLPYGRWTGGESRAQRRTAPRAGRPTASSTPRCPRSGPVDTRPPRSTPWPRAWACASSRSCTGSRPKRPCSKR